MNIERMIEGSTIEIMFLDHIRRIDDEAELKAVILAMNEEFMNLLDMDVSEYVSFVEEMFKKKTAFKTLFDL